MKNPLYHDPVAAKGLLILMTSTAFDVYSLPKERVGENNAPRTCVRSVAGAY